MTQHPPAPEDRIRDLAEQIRTIIETEIVTERQAEMESMAITEISATDHETWAKLGFYGETTS